MIGSCAGTKVTFAPVRFSNSARTFLKFACSAPVHTAATSSVVPFSLGRVTPPPVSSVPVPLPLPVLLSSSPPHAVSESARAPAASAAAAFTVLRVRMVLLVLRITTPFIGSRRTSSAVP